MRSLRLARLTALLAVSWLAVAGCAGVQTEESVGNPFVPNSIADTSVLTTLATTPATSPAVTIADATGTTTGTEVESPESTFPTWFTTLAATLLVPAGEVEQFATEIFGVIAEVDPALQPIDGQWTEDETSRLFANYGTEQAVYHALPLTNAGAAGLFTLGIDPRYASAALENFGLRLHELVVLKAIAFTVGLTDPSGGDAWQPLAAWVNARHLQEQSTGSIADLSDLTNTATRLVAAQATMPIELAILDVLNTRLPEPVPSANASFSELADYVAGWDPATQRRIGQGLLNANLTSWSLNEVGLGTAGFLDLVRQHQVPVEDRVIEGETFTCRWTICLLGSGRDLTNVFDVPPDARCYQMGDAVTGHDGWVCKSQ